MKNTRLPLWGARIFFCVILQVIIHLGFIEKSVAQAPAANFSASVTTGCSPLIVQFTDLSAGNPTSWYWDLGNGSTSSVKNPTSTYVNAGTYTISLTATNASGSSTYTKTITVTAAPVVKFTSTDTSGCTPHTVSFYDQSTFSGTITQWEWNFGDGATSNLQHPTHTYTMSGTFNVFLKVTTSTGCTQTLFRQQYIRTGAGTQANFIANIPNQCQVPVNVSFTNNSTSDGAVSYVWNFGDGSSSADINPTHTYTAFGNYTVTLTVQNPDGCNSTKQQVINLSGKNVDFNGPATVCAGSPANFEMTSSPAPLSQTWNMGDGTGYTTSSVIHQYNNPGTYTITLTNEFSGGCIATKTKSVNVIAGPAINILADTTKACKPPFAVNFQASGAASGFSWDFGDGTTSSQQNPSHIYQAHGDFTVTLSATNTNGCTSTVAKPGLIKIQLPSVAITNVPVNGCTPYSFSPQANINAAEGVAAYYWDFGDGSTSTGEEPSHTYNTPGSYTVRLRIQTNGGCADSVVYPNAVNISNGTSFDFSGSPVNTCVEQSVNFAMSAGPAPVTYQWYFGDGDSSSLATPSHIYKTPGKYSVSLMINYGSCISKLRKNEYITVQPPEARFTAERDCSNKRLINFTNQSVGTGSMLWNFGDGVTSSAANPSHLYSSDGSYTVTLTVNNGSCSHTITHSIQVSSVTIDIAASKTVMCKGDGFMLKAIIPNTIQPTEYQWVIPNSGTATTAVDSIAWAFYAAGTYDVSLKVVSGNGCEDIVTKNAFITVYGPTAAFTSNKTGGCENSTIDFSDSSSSDGIHAITAWSWNFGDGSAAVSGTQVSHTFSGSNKYDISLSVKDTYGCINTIVKTNYVSITNGKAFFTATDSLGCSGRNVVFNDSSTGNIASWEWSFGDGSGLNGVQHPAHIYTDSGYYTVKLKIIETSGCADSITRLNYITIKNPVARFGLSDTFSTCPPLTVSFYDSSYYVKKWFWDFDDGGSSPVASPTNLYNIPKTYQVKLTVTSHGGCTDTASATIRILGPYGQFTYTPLSGCTPLAVNYSVSSTQAVKFLWDYSDGVVDSSNSASTMHTYITGGRFVPKVILTDVAGCNVPVTGTDTIYIEKTMLSFSADETSFCDSGTVVFSNGSIVNAPSAQYQWIFPGNTVNAPDATHHFNSPGLYDVSLTSVTPMGCRDTLTKPAFIRINKSPVATIVSEDSLCRPASFHFTAQLQPETSAIINWRWSFGNAQTSLLQNPPAQLFEQDGSFTNTLFIEDNDGCSTTVSKTVVVHPLPPVQALQNTMICRGDTTQLTVRGAVTYSWLAPNNDLSCTSCADPVASPLYNTMYKVEGTSMYGCKAYDSVTVQVFQPYKISVAAAAGSICDGKSMQLKAAGAPLYRWSPETGLNATNISSPFASPDTSTVYKVIGYDSLGCFQDSAEVAVTVLGVPTVNAGADMILSAGSSANIHSAASADVIRYNWSPATGFSCTDCPDPVVTAGTNLTYTVKVTNAAGCSAQDQLNIIVTCNGENIFIPNTFTPNADGMNDVFFVRGKGLFEIKSLRVFNRWGEMLFEKKNVTPNNPLEGWDGTYKGTTASTDTYVYVMEVACTNGAVLKYNGTVNLIR